MTQDSKISLASVLERFPANNDSKDNSAIRLYGKRFYKDQTPVEYLAEFLLVFASPKEKNGEGSYQFKLDEGKEACYWPEDRIWLKLFSFFPSSKLETRHIAHHQAYKDVLKTIKQRVGGTSEQQEETVRLIQSLFGGFVGVAKNRTWVTYSFLPVTTGLLARKLDWLHSKANRDNKESWESVVDSYSYFAHDRHNFMARGGKLLYLQIVNMFNQLDTTEICNFLNEKEYQHLATRKTGLRNRIEDCLRSMLEDSVGQLSCLVNLIEEALDEYKIKSDSKKVAYLGWAPVASRTEALLFTLEMDNICSSNIGTLDKLELLQILCCMQVLRSLCFQARRIDGAEKVTQGFRGNYAWVITEPDVKAGTPIRRMAEISFQRVEDLLYRVLKNNELSGVGCPEEAKKHGFQIFRKISKEIGLVVPRQGNGQRFTLHQGLLRFLVAALVSPGECIRLTHFYQRVFAHYGIALGGEQLAVALNWCGNENEGGSYAISSSTAWVEEALQQGGFLVELSDAVSMVKNPG